MGKKYSNHGHDEYKNALKELKVYYLIDTENVKSDVFASISFLDRRHTLYFMNTKNSNCIHPDLVGHICNCRCKKVFEDTKLEEATPNALDFKIIARATEILLTKKDSYVVIVSGDKGFDSGIDYIRKVLGIKYIRREETIFNPFINFDDIKLSTNDLQYYKRNY